MDPHILSTHSKMIKASDAIVTALHLLKEERPAEEVLSVLDRGIVALNDAKIDLNTFRKNLYEENRVSPEPEPHVSAEVEQCPVPGL